MYYLCLNCKREIKIGDYYYGTVRSWESYKPCIHCGATPMYKCKYGCDNVGTYQQVQGDPTCAKKTRCSAEVVVPVFIEHPDSAILEAYDQNLFRWKHLPKWKRFLTKKPQKPMIFFG